MGSVTLVWTEVKQVVCEWCNKSEIHPSLPPLSTNAVMFTKIQVRPPLSFALPPEKSEVPQGDTVI